MAQKSKLQKEYQVEDDGTTVIPKEILPQVAPTALKNTVKRERTEAQKANFAKVVEANKERWAKLRADKEAVVAQTKQSIKDDHQEKIEAGTHVRVVVKEKRVQQPRKHSAKEPVSESEEEEEEIVIKPQRVPVVKEKPMKVDAVKSKKQRVVYETDTDTPTETETDDTDYEEYKSGKRQIRREVKKNIKALERIDSVVQSTARNPYFALLESKWK
jgi:hypothetical protein